jgi:hypothetical protein
MEINHEKLRTWFWIIFICIPIFTGFLGYENAENEYDSRKHIALGSHSVECGPEGLVSCERVDVWKDLKSGKIFHLSEFKTHRRYQAFRIACLSFFYGLIGCIFYVFYEVRYGIKNIDVICFGDIEREKLYRTQIFNQALKHALIFNGSVAVFWFLMI